MSDSLHIDPTSPIGGAAPVQPVRPARPVGTPAERRPEPDGHSVAATTGGTLRAAYAQFIINPDTNDVVVRIKDAVTDQVLSELPSRQVQIMSRYLKDYAETMARHRAAYVQPGTSS